MSGETPLPTLIASYRTSGVGLVSRRGCKTSCEQASVQVRNTFIDSGLSRTSSFEDFFQERDVLSCPSRHIGRLTGLLQELELGGEEVAPILTPSRGTPSRGPSPARSPRGLVSVPDTPLDRESFSVAGSLQDHVRMIEKLAQSQRQNLPHAQVAQQAPAPTVHQLAPAISQAAPEPPRACRTVLKLDDAIEGSTGAAIAQVAAKVPPVQGNCGEGQHIYSSGMAPQALPPPTGYHGGANQLRAYEAYSNGCMLPSSGLPPSAVSCGGASPTLAASTPVPVLAAPTPSVALHSQAAHSSGYGHGASVGQRIDVRSSAFQANVVQYSSFTTRGNDVNYSPVANGLTVVTHGHELPASSHAIATPSPPPGPALGSPEMPSTGSAGHDVGRCKPCAFMHNKGCENGIVCQFCHLCEPGEKKRRHKEKLSNRRKAKQAFSTDVDSVGS